MMPAMPRTPREELDTRIRRLQGLLVTRDIDGALILQNTDLFYLAGTIQQAHLYIPADGEPLLMVRKSLERARNESSLTRIVPLRSPREIPDLLKAHGLRLGVGLFHRRRTGARDRPVPPPAGPPAGPAGRPRPRGSGPSRTR